MSSGLRASNNTQSTAGTGSGGDYHQVDDQDKGDSQEDDDEEGCKPCATIISLPFLLIGIILYPFVTRSLCPPRGLILLWLSGTGVLVDQQALHLRLPMLLMRRRSS